MGPLRICSYGGDEGMGLKAYGGAGASQSGTLNRGPCLEDRGLSDPHFPIVAFAINGSDSLLFKIVLDLASQVCLSLSTSCHFFLAKP